MPDRYTDDRRRPVQGEYNANTSRPAQRPVQNRSARPAQRPLQNGGARPVQRPVQNGNTRPAQRPMQNGNARPVQRPMQNGNARPAQRPVQNGNARPVQRPMQNGNARPAQRPVQNRSARPTQRPVQNRSARPTQRPVQNRSARPTQRPVQNRSARPAQYAPQRSASRPVQRRSERPAASFLNMTPGSRALCGVLCVALLVVICLAVTSRIRSNIPQPGISMATDAPQTTETPAPSDDVSVDPIETPASGGEVLGGLPTPGGDASNSGALTQPASGRSVRIRAMGDVIIDDDMLATAYDKSTDSYDFDPLFELAQGVMSDADWSIINIEATLREGKYGYKGYPMFSTPPSILDSLKACGIDMLTMCNNHALDGYFDGLKMSLDFADEAGLAHVGAYRTQQEHDTPEVYDIGGIKVGMLNYTQYTNGMASVSDENATIYGMRLMENARYASDIADLKAAGAEYTIVVMHWGDEYVRYPDSDIEQVAKKLVAAGADLVIGGHPHVVQPAEYVTATDANGVSRTALVVYSLGNFVSNHRHENAAYTDNGVIFDFTLQENAAGQIELVDPNLIPVYVWKRDSGSGDYIYTVVASGDYLNTDAPAGMSADEASRMRESYREIEALTGSTITIRAH